MSTPPLPASPLRAAPPTRARRGPARGGLLRYIGGVISALALLLLLIWVFGKTVSDQWLYSQYLAWIPTPVLLAPALTCIALGLPARRLRHDGARARIIPALHTGAAIFGVIATFHFVFFELHMLRALGGAATPSEASSIRLLQWNGSYNDVENWSGAYADLAPGRLPDVFLITTSQRPGPVHASAASLGPGYQLARDDSFVVVSRLPITYFKWLQLNLNTFAGPTSLQAQNDENTTDQVDPNIRRPARNWLIRVWNHWASTFGIPPRQFAQGESGFIQVVTIDTTAVLGRPTTIWFIDLPSDPFVFRWEIARYSRYAIDRMMRTTNPENGGPLLPPADIIIGDTNIPRGSASLDVLTGGMPHAYDQAGWGLVATWPRVMPMLHIDHTFIVKGLRAATYSIVRPPVSDHCMQVVDVVRER